MCTLSWLRAPGGYAVLFNRDERRTRPPAQAPIPHTVRGVRVLHPIDPEGGGTWLGVNELGVAVALANRYGGTPPAPRVSRGVLVTGLLDAPDVATIRSQLAAADLARHDGFTLVAFEPETAPWLLAWDGTRREERLVGREGLVITTSAVAQAAVAASRHAVFAAAAERADLRRVHASHEPERGPHSVCMHRPDAETVSHSEVDVSAESVVFRYQPGAPCLGAAVTVARLARRVSAA